MDDMRPAITLEDLKRGHIEISHRKFYIQLLDNGVYPNHFCSNPFPESIPLGEGIYFHEYKVSSVRKFWYGTKAYAYHFLVFCQFGFVLSLTFMPYMVLEFLRGAL